MSEEDRMIISTMFYQYEIDSDNAIIPNTEKILPSADLRKLVELESLVLIINTIQSSMIRASPS